MQSLQHLDSIGQPMPAANAGHLRLVGIIEAKDILAFAIAADRRKRHQLPVQSADLKTYTGKLARAHADWRGVEMHFNTSLASGRVENWVDALNGGRKRRIPQRVDANLCAISELQIGHDQLRNLEIRDQ